MRGRRARRWLVAALLVTLATMALATLVHGLLGALGARYISLVETRLPPPHGPPPDIDAIGYVQRAVCPAWANHSSSSPKAAGLLLVVSHAGSRHARDAMRVAYPAGVLRSLGLSRVFLLGTLREGREPDSDYLSVAQSELRIEQARHQDLVQISLVESYASLTEKTLAGLRWVRDHCPPDLRALVKMDDDAVVDAWQLRAMLLRVRSDLPQAHGRLEHDQTDFLLGLLYVLTNAAVPLLLSASLATASHSHEDVYVTGYLADAAGVARVDVGGRVTAGADLRCCPGWRCARLVGQVRGHGARGDHAAAQCAVASHAARCERRGCWTRPVLLAAIWPCPPFQQGDCPTMSP